MFLGNFSNLYRKNISLKHLEIQLIWQNHYLSREHLDTRHKDSKQKELGDMSKLVSFSKIINRRKSTEKEVLHEIERFFKTQQDKIKKILEQRVKLQGTSITKTKNKRHKIRILVQDADSSFFWGDDKIGIVSFNEDKFLLKEGFFNAIINLLSYRAVQVDPERSYKSVYLKIESIIKNKVDLLTNHKLFPNTYVLSNLLEACIYSSLHSEKSITETTTNFKVFNLIKYKQTSLFASNIADLLSNVELCNQGTGLVIKKDKCWNNLLVHVRLKEERAKIEIELVNEGHRLNVLDFNRSIFVVLNNEIIYNSCEFFKNQFLNVEVKVLFKVKTGKFAFGTEGASAFTFAGSVVEDPFEVFSTRGRPRALLQVNFFVSC